MVAKLPVLTHTAYAIHNNGVMRAIAAGTGLVLAIVIAMGAVLQVNALQDLSKPITSGSLNQMLGATTFIMLLVAVVVALFALGGVLLWLTNR